MVNAMQVSGIYERDTDLLLLVEEFIAAPSLLAWFLGQIRITSPADPSTSRVAR
jgi:hypothetical protein